MPAYALVNFLIYCLVNSFTPGPGNILALNTVTNYGWKKGKPLFFGIFAGYYAVQFLCALVVYGVNAMLPGVMGVIKYVGAAYILWLAVHIALSRPDLDQGEQSASFWKGFVLQFVNVKIYFGPARPAVFRGDDRHHRDCRHRHLDRRRHADPAVLSGPLQAGEHPAGPDPAGVRLWDTEISCRRAPLCAGAKNMIQYGQNRTEGSRTWTYWTS